MVCTFHWTDKSVFLCLSLQICPKLQYEFWAMWRFYLWVCRTQPNVPSSQLSLLSFPNLLSLNSASQRLVPVFTQVQNYPRHIIQIGICVWFLICVCVFRCDYCAQCRCGYSSRWLHHKKTQTRCKRSSKACHDLQRRVPSLLFHALYCWLWEHQPRWNQYSVHHRVMENSLQTHKYSSNPRRFEWCSIWILQAHTDSVSPEPDGKL